MTQELLVCSGLTKRFGRKEALKNVNLRLEGGKIIGLLGPNGSGKTTFIKLVNGLLMPDAGSILIDGQAPGVYSKSIISYLPDRMYFANWMRVKDIVELFHDFYQDFSKEKAVDMLNRLNISLEERMKHLSKGNKEKVQLVLVMSRRAKLYLLDEPIGGVDPAARDFILHTILTNYSEDASVLISTHLIADGEQDSVDHIRESEGMSVDQLFRSIFAVPESGYQGLWDGAAGGQAGPGR